MSYPIRIDLPMFDLSVDRIENPVEQYIILNETHLLYRLEVYVKKQPKLDEGEYEVKDSYINYTGIYLRSAITSVDLDFDQSNENYEFWCVEINVMGMRSDIRIKCETQTKGQRLFDQIKNYILRIEN